MTNKQQEIVVLLFTIICVCNGATINWLGGVNDNLWSSALNWDTKTVPNANDTVIINGFGGADVKISTPAYADSVTIGGGSFAQSLTLLSGLNVGSLLVLAQGQLHLTGNNDSPLNTSVSTTIRNGGLLSFESGTITGTGKYIVESTGSIIFRGSAQKEIRSTVLSIAGQAVISTVQQATIQFTNAATVTVGNITVAGEVLFFASDTTASSLVVTGLFLYQYAAGKCSFNVKTVIKDITITAGILEFENNADVQGALTLSNQANLIVQGTGTAAFSTISSQGTISIYTVATVGTLNAVQALVASAGSFTVNAASTVTSLTIYGKIILNGVVKSPSVVLGGGAIAGTAALQADTLKIAQSNSQATTSSLYTEIQISSSGVTENEITVLFYNGANLHITSGATFVVSSKTSFQSMDGTPTPLIRNENVFSVQLPDGGTFDSSVDLLGGTLNMRNGAATFSRNQVTVDQITTSGGLLTFVNGAANTGAVTGTGSLNVGTGTNKTSTFASVQIALFGVTGGIVNVTSLAVSTLNINQGQLNLGTATTHKTSELNISGGTIYTNATLAATTLTIAKDTTSIIDGVQITAQKFSYKATLESDILLKNGGSITIG